MCMSCAAWHTQHMGCKDERSTPAALTLSAKTLMSGCISSAAPQVMNMPLLLRPWKSCRYVGETCGSVSRSGSCKEQTPRATQGTRATEQLSSTTRHKRQRQHSTLLLRTSCQLPQLRAAASWITWQSLVHIQRRYPKQ